MIKKRLLVFFIGVILVALLVIVGVFIRGPHTFVLNMTPSGSPSNSPSSSQPMGTTGGPWPSGSGSPTPPPTTSGPPSSSPTPSMSMSPFPTPGGGPYTIISEGDLDIEVSGAHGIIHVKWHTTSATTGVKTVYLGVKGGSPSFSFQIDLSQGSGEYDISGPISGGPPGPLLRLQTGYCYVDFYFDKYSVEVDFPISPGCYEVVLPPQGKAGIFGYVYDANDPDHPRINAASVTLEDAAGYAVYPGTILTNPEGEYAYTNVNPGTYYKLVVMKDGYERKEIPNITLQAGVEKNQNAGLMSQAPPKVKFTFAANIYNTQYQNFANDVKVRLESDQYPGYAWSTTSSGANIDPAKYGDYTNLIMKDIPIDIAGINQYHFTGTTESPAYMDTSFDFYVNLDQLTFDYNANAYVVRKNIPVTPKPTLTIKCKVINGLTGEPIEGATVKIINEPLDWELSGNTNSNGIVWFYNYPIDDDSGGAAIIHAQASYPRFKVDEEEISFHNSDAGSTHLFTFSLIPIQGQYVYGRVIDKDTKKPINGARVQIIKNDQFTGKEGTTNQYGRYYIENPGSGDMAVRALHVDYYDDFASRKEITLAAGEDKEVNFRLRKLTSSVNTFDLTINHVYKLVNGQQVLIGDQDAVEVLIASGGTMGSKRYTYGDRVSHLGPRVPFHIFYRLPVKRVFVEATIFNPADNDPGWVPRYRGVVEVVQTTSDPRTIDLVLEPILEPPDYSGGAILRGTTYLFQDPCQALLDNFREFMHMTTTRVPAPKGIPVYLYRAYDLINPIQTTKTDIYGKFEFTGVEEGIYDIKVESINYLGWQETRVEGRDNVKNYSIILEAKGTGLTKIRHYGNVEVRFIGFGSHSYIAKFNWNSEINKLVTIYNQTGQVSIPKIYVVESDTYVGAFIQDICGARIVLSTKLLQDLLDSQLPLHYILTHEYGHKFFIFGGVIGGHFATIFNAAQDTAPCSFSRITDSNIELGRLYAGHPQDNTTEYFASFFTAYFLHHDRLLDTIRNNTSGQCKYTLAYTWQWFAENVGKVYTNDDAVFHPLNGAIKGIDYTKAQIKNGDWIDPAYR